MTTLTYVRKAKLRKDGSCGLLYVEGGQRGYRLAKCLAYLPYPWPIGCLPLVFDDRDHAQAYAAATIREGRRLGYSDWTRAIEI